MCLLPIKKKKEQNDSIGEKEQWKKTWKEKKDMDKRELERYYTDSAAEQFCEHFD